MKRLFILPVIGFSFTSCAKTEENFLESKDAYFGLKPPGLTPEVFATGIVSDSTWAEHCQVAVTPDGNKLYFYSMGIEGGYGNKDVWFVTCRNIISALWQKALKSTTTHTLNVKPHKFLL